PVHELRPIDPPPVPVAALEPVVVPEPVAAPPVVPMPLAPPPSTRLTWRCSKVLEVGPVMEVLNAPWNFFVITIDDEPRVLVTTARTKKGLKDIRKIAQAVKGCRGSDSVLIAKRANQSHEGLMGANTFFYRGVEVAVGDLSVASAAPSY
ncbi:MAG: hypothetical protein H6Q89_2422, partial [Myxococcaceae bacterium]|nr:hypothetical protein [Myxococcaceae bacterium]